MENLPDFIDVDEISNMILKNHAAEFDPEYSVNVESLISLIRIKVDDEYKNKLLTAWFDFNQGEIELLITATSYKDMIEFITWKIIKKIVANKAITAIYKNDFSSLHGTTKEISNIR